MSIHPTAIIAADAQIGDDCHIGPYCVVEEGVILGSRAMLGPRVHIVRGTSIGSDARIYDGAIVGSDPQDLKYRGAETKLVIGDRVKIREYCTLNRGTSPEHSTYVGNDVLLMAYSHVAHDCCVDDGVILANGVQLGGHVRLGQRSVIGGNTAVHQFSEVGAFSFVGGTLKIDRHVPPFSKALGDPLRWAGVNTIGIERSEFARWTAEIARFYKGLQRGKYSWELFDVVKAEDLPVEIPAQVSEMFKGFLQRCRGKILSVQRRAEVF